MKALLKLLLSIAIISIYSCSSDFSTGDSELFLFTPESNYPVGYSQFDYIELEDSVFHVDIVFDSTCLYESEISWQNKIGGVAPTVHKDWNKYSGRLVWKPLGDSISISAYVYDPMYGDKPYKELICNVGINKRVELLVIPGKDYYYFKVNDVDLYVTKEYSEINYKYFSCIPYFGGEYKPPHEMKLTYYWF